MHASLATHLEQKGRVGLADVELAHGQRRLERGDVALEVLLQLAHVKDVAVPSRVSQPVGG